MLLAEDFFRLAHNDVTGRPLLHPTALSTGLAAALLCDLVWVHQVHVQAGQVYCVSGREPQQRLLAKVTAMLRLESHPLPVWLEFLARGVVHEVADHLARSGHLRAERPHRPRRGAAKYVPADSSEFYRPRAVLAVRLASRLDLEPWYVCLGGLMAATGLDAVILDGASAEAHTYLRELVAELPASLRELFAHTEAMIGAAVLAHRT